jgi:hypothetical protein
MTILLFASPHHVALTSPTFVAHGCVVHGVQKPPTCVALSADEHVAYSGGKDGAVIRYDVETGEEGERFLPRESGAGFVESWCFVATRRPDVPAAAVAAELREAGA